MMLPHFHGLRFRYKYDANRWFWMTFGVPTNESVFERPFEYKDAYLLSLFFVKFDTQNNLGDF